MHSKQQWQAVIKKTRIVNLASTLFEGTVTLVILEHALWGLLQKRSWPHCCVNISVCFSCFLVESTFFQVTSSDDSKTQNFFVSAVYLLSYLKETTSDHIRNLPSHHPWLLKKAIMLRSIICWANNVYGMKVL